MPKPKLLSRSVFDRLFWALIIIGVMISLFIVFFVNEGVVYRALAVAWLLGSVLLVGVTLPKRINRHVRIQRAKAAKESEFDKWGFASRDRDGPWVNYIGGALLHQTDKVANMYFYSEWLVIHDGLIIVNPGPSDISDSKVTYDFDRSRTYAWDGCSPKIWFYWFLLLGTPDFAHKPLTINRIKLNGQQLEKTTHSVFWQSAHLASLIHDALYQYLDSIPLSKSEVDKLFADMLVDIGFPKVVANIYHLAVRVGGAMGVNQPNLGKTSDFECMNDLDGLKLGQV